MSNGNNRRTGGIYEQMAGLYLIELGYQIVQFNYRCAAGEVDIIAKDGSYLVFCEVKYRKNFCKGTPQEAVSLRKQQTIVKCARFYLMQQHLSNCDVRFDVVAITGNCGAEEITLIPDAFECL